LIRELNPEIREKVILDGPRVLKDLRAKRTWRSDIVLLLLNFKVPGFARVLEAVRYLVNT